LYSFRAQIDATAIPNNTSTLKNFLKLHWDFSMAMNAWTADEIELVAAELEYAASKFRSIVAEMRPNSLTP
jgi:hypothetical protein